MGIKTIRHIAIIITVAFFVSGCGFIYEKNVNNAYSKLKIGMTKVELDKAFKNVKFLKEQTVVKYPGSSGEDMRHVFEKYNHFEDIYPKDIFRKISYDGSVKVISYFVKKDIAWPNGWTIHYISIFHDIQNNKVIGWSKLQNNSNIVRNWDEKF